MMITLTTYMPNESPNAMCVDLGEIRLYYSYDILIAYWTRDEGMVISDNSWSRTTGKHINHLRHSIPLAHMTHPVEFATQLADLTHRIDYALTHLELARRMEEYAKETK